MDIVNIKTSDLQEYANNPRNNDGAVEAVAESIKQFGFKVPIIVDRDGVIVAGHTRKKAAELLGLASVPCVVADDLTPEQIKAFRLADNKTGDLAEWDFAALEKELTELTAFDVDMSAFGYDESIFDASIGDVPDEIPLPRDEVGTSVMRKSLKFGSVTIYMSDEEAERFENLYDLYMEQNGNVFGLVSELLDFGDKNYAG